MADIKEKYNASKHPDVIQGKKTEQTVLCEFLETFEAHHNILNGTQSDGSVTMEEFIEYYTNISSSIDNDEHFELIMNNAWNVKGNAATYNKYEKGWSQDDTGGKPIASKAPPKEFRPGYQKDPV